MARLSRLDLSEKYKLPLDFVMRLLAGFDYGTGTVSRELRKELLALTPNAIIAEKFMTEVYEHIYS